MLSGFPFVQDITLVQQNGDSNVYQAGSRVTIVGVKATLKWYELGLFSMRTLRQLEPESVSALSLGKGGAVKKELSALQLGAAGEYPSITPYAIMRAARVSNAKLEVSEDEELYPVLQSAA